MLRYTKQRQKELRIERAKELIDYCGGPAHLHGMIVDATISAVTNWRVKGIPKTYITLITDHPGIPKRFTRQYLLALDKVK